MNQPQQIDTLSIGQKVHDQLSAHDELTLNEGDFGLLKIRHAEAELQKKPTFLFKGHVFNTDYAKYLIEHLTNIGFAE